jgi:hypothetical protein
VGHLIKLIKSHPASVFTYSSLFARSEEEKQQDQNVLLSQETKPVQGLLTVIWITDN